MDDVTPFVPEGEPSYIAVPNQGVGADSNAFRKTTLPERADEIERRLGMALRAYRQQAEGILEEHFETMEKVQNAYDHEVTMLKAENHHLRDMIGKAQGDPAFFAERSFPEYGSH